MAASLPAVASSGDPVFWRIAVHEPAPSLRAKADLPGPGLGMGVHGSSASCPALTLEHASALPCRILFSAQCERKAW